MFKDKVKLTVVAMVMALFMVLGVTADLFVELADVFRVKASEATPTDATDVTRDVTVYKELNDSDEGRSLAGIVVKVYEDEGCTVSVAEFALSYDGKAYGSDERVVFKSFDEKASASTFKAIASLTEHTYYYKLDKKLFKSEDNFSKTGYEFNKEVGSFTVSAGDGVQEIKLDDKLFKPVKKLATPSDAGEEISTEEDVVTTEAITEVTTEEVAEATTEGVTEAEEEESIVTVEPVATLAFVMRAAIASLAATDDVYIWGTEDQGCGNYHTTSSSATSANTSLSGDIGSRTFCVDWSANGPSAANGYTNPVKYIKGATVGANMRKVVAYYYEVLSKNATTLAETEHYLSLLNGNKGETPSWSSAALNYIALAKGEQVISIDKTTPTAVCYDTFSFGTSYTEKNVFVSDVVTVTAKSTSQYFNFKVPSGCTVYVYRNSKWVKVTADGEEHHLKGGDKFRIVTSKTNAKKTFTMKGTAQYSGWDVNYYEPNDPAWIGCQQMLMAAETAKPTFSLSITTPVVYDPISIVINKVDSVLEDGTVVGKASLAGAVFKMEYFKGKATASGTADNVWYLKTKYDDGRYVARFAEGFLYSDSTYKSDAAPANKNASGVYELEDGAMRITEVKAPSGYQVVDGKNKGYFELKGKVLEDVSSVTVQVMGGKTIYADNEITEDGFKQYEQKERYHFKLKKVDKYGRPMAGVAFLVTSSSGQKHVVVTNKNGIFDSTKMSYKDVNGNDDTLAKALADTSLYPTYKETSVFFTTDSKKMTAAEEIKADTVGSKAPGPLYKDTYTIREIRRQYVTVDGKKRKLTEVYDIPEAKTIIIGDNYKDGDVIEFGTHENTAKLSIASTAIDADTGTKISAVSENASFTDSVICQNLKLSTKYTLMSIAVDKATGKAYKDANGNLVAKNQVFISNANEENADIPMTEASVTYTGINTTNAGGKKITFFEYLVEGSVSSLVSVDEDGKPVVPDNCVAMDASTY